MIYTAIITPFSPLDARRHVQNEILQSDLVAVHVIQQRQFGGPHFTSYLWRQLNLQLRELHILFDSSGAAYTAKVVSFSEEEKIQLNVWDTSGAERFDSLTKLYYRDAQV